MSYRYIGNKSRVLKKLMPVIGSLVSPGATVADLMCGTASVSEALRVSGYRVIASDIMTFAVQHARVRLTMEKEPEFAGIGGRTYREVLSYLQSLYPSQGYMVREYSPAGAPSEGHPPRKYFTTENAAKIDAIRAAINGWEEQGLLTENERALLRHDLVLAANKVANIAGTYGHFRSTWTNGSQNPLTLEPSNFIFGYRTDHMVLPAGPAEKAASQLTADLCYLDPPYMKRQYAANYHILETLARGDEPPAIGVSGLRPWRDQYSDFCSKVKIRQAFTDIIQQMNCPQFLISYSEDGLIPKEELKKFFEQFGSVEIKEFTHQRFRSNSSPLGSTLTEYLFHLKKT
jgi:adenine-specific DNA-methyltransferase